VAELPNEIALWSFSSTTVVEQDFTSDRLLLNSAIDRAKHQRGSTNLALAYQQAAVSFDGIESSSAIVLITDGVPDDLDRAISFKPNVLNETLFILLLSFILTILWDRLRS